MDSPSSRRTQRLRCFVAMAFDHADTDAAYIEVKRILHGIDVLAIRVDRLEHNDDIDDRIISEIKRADFALADLTYARPSVYYEAGFAQRCIPVVYTVRSDHFRPRTDDPNGNLRVHFDLQMKNIIRWKSPSDPKFSKRLKSRILKLVAPLRTRSVAHEEVKARLARFQGQSRQEQRDSLLETMRQYFGGRQKYRVVELIENSEDSSDFTPVTLNHFPGAMVGTKRDGATFRFVFFHVVPSITKALCRDYRYGLLRLPMYSMKFFNNPIWTPRKVCEEIFICSHGTRGVLRLASEIPYLHRGPANGTLKCTQPASIVRPGGLVEVTRYITIHVIESALRLANLEEQLKLRFDEHLESL